MIRRIKRRYRLWQIERRIDKIEERYTNTGVMFKPTEQELIALFQEQSELLGEN